MSDTNAVQPKKSKGKIAKTVIDVILWIFLAFAILMTIIAFTANASGKNFPTLGNKCYMSVLTDSMENSPYNDLSARESKNNENITEYNFEFGGFNAGDLLICEMLNTPEDKAQLKVGDIICFWGEVNGNDAIITHRIVAITGEAGNREIITRGDNPLIEENDSVKDENGDLIVAKWTGKKIAGLGAVLSFFQSSTGFLICIVIPLAIFFIFELVKLIIVIVKMNDKKRPLLTKEEEEAIKQRAIAEYLASQTKKEE